MTKRSLLINKKPTDTETEVPAHENNRLSAIEINFSFNLVWHGAKGIKKLTEVYICQIANKQKKTQRLASLRQQSTQVLKRKRILKRHLPAKVRLGINIHILHPLQKRKGMNRFPHCSLKRRKTQSLSPHKKNRARVSAITAFSREKEKSPPDYIRTICKHYVRICVKT